MYMHCNYVHVCMQLHASDVCVQLFVSDSANLEPTALQLLSNQTTHKKSRAVHIRGPTIEMYEGPQGPGTKLMKSDTVLAIQGPLRPMSMTISRCLVLTDGAERVLVAETVLHC